MPSGFKTIVTIGLLMLSELPASAQISFRGLGDLEGGRFVSIAFDLSDDGRVVVGWSYSGSGAEAFRWTAAEGMQGLGDLPGGDFQSGANGVSGDGNVVVGCSTTETGGRAFRWDPTGGMQPLEHPESSVSCATDVSSDGSAIVGISIRASAGAARWDAPTFSYTGLSGGKAYGVSSTGLVVVGEGWSGRAYEPIRWVGLAAAEGLGGDRGEARAATPNGEIIVGWTTFGSTEFAFRWVEARPPKERMERLADPLGVWSRSRALDVSADGSVTVGYGVPSGEGEQGFIWDPANGMRSAKAVLETDYCLDLSDWAYVQTTCVSANGLTLAGSGGSRNGGRTEAWIARITPLSQADRDGDGTPNCADGCPDDPNKIEPGTCGCGIADADSDTDGVLDCLDNCPNHSNARQADCDGDGTGDVCAIETGLSPDCNRNAVPDGCDIDDGKSLDRNDNSVPDECDPDCNGNNMPDDIDIAAGTSLDCNGNTLPDECETSDGTTPDCNGNRVPDECEIAAIHNCCEIGHGSGCNDPEIEACACGLDSFCCETDWDRTCVDRVTDDACGTCEMVSDCNGNAVPDECEPDCNQNSVADECDITGGASPDCQGNDVPDECEADFDEDGTIDDCDADMDDDGIPNESDVCLFTPLGNPINEQGRSIGDLDGDCLATLSDFRFFAICLSLSGPWQPPGFQDCIDVFDFDADGDVDLRDFAGFAAAVVAKR